MDNLSQSKSSIASSAGKFVKMSQSTKLGVATFKTLPLDKGKLKNCYRAPSSNIFFQNQKQLFTFEVLYFFKMETMFQILGHPKLQE